MTADGEDWAIAALAVSAVMSGMDRDTAISELTAAAEADVRMFSTGRRGASMV